MSNTTDTQNMNIEELTKNIKHKILVQELIAGLIVFIFAFIVFIVIKILGSGNSEDMPIAQIKQNGEWIIIREQEVYGWHVDENAVGVDYVYNESEGTYDLILHYVPVDSVTP